MWAGYLGLGETTTHAERLARWLGEAAQIRTGPGYAVGVRPGDVDDARLDRAGDGRVVLTVDVNGDRTTVAALEPGSARPYVTLTPDPFGLHGCFVSPAMGPWFASDPGLFLNDPRHPSRIDAAALHGYLCFSYVPTPRTIDGRFLSVPTRERWLASPEGGLLEQQEPWREGERTRLTEDEAARELRRRLQECVTRRLGDERDVGVFLSGGLDSSLIAALLKEAGASVRLFTLDFGSPFDAELPYARRVAAHLESPLHVVPARPSEVRAALRATAAALRQPFGDGVTVPLYLLGKAAAEHVGVIYNGEGGDQLFGGWANKPMVAAEIYGGGAYDRIEAYLDTLHRFLGQTDSLYTKAARAETATVDVRAWLDRALRGDPSDSLLHWLRAANLRLKGAQNIAPRAVQLAAAHGLKVRMPFFDRALAEWTFSLPPEWLLRGACEKAILKQVAATYLPSEIVEREKRGMGVPVTDWCLGELRRDVVRVLNPWRLRRDGWFDPAVIAALRRGEDHPAEFRRRRAGEKLWALLMLHLWVDVRPSVRFRW